MKFNLKVISEDEFGIAHMRESQFFSVALEPGQSLNHLIEKYFKDLSASELKQISENYSEEATRMEWVLYRNRLAGLDFSSPRADDAAQVKVMDILNGEEVFLEPITFYEIFDNYEAFKNKLPKDPFQRLHVITRALGTRFSGSMGSSFLIPGNYVVYELVKWAEENSDFKSKARLLALAHKLILIPDYKWDIWTGLTLFATVQFTEEEKKDIQNKPLWNTMFPLIADHLLAPNYRNLMAAVEATLNHELKMFKEYVPYLDQIIKSLKQYHEHLVEMYQNESRASSWFNQKEEFRMVGARVKQALDKLTS